MAARCPATPRIVYLWHRCCEVELERVLRTIVVATHRNSSNTNTVLRAHPGMRIALRVHAPRVLSSSGRG